MAPQITVGMGGAERSCTITVVGPAARTQTVATMLVAEHVARHRLPGQRRLRGDRRRLHHPRVHRRAGGHAVHVHRRRGRRVRRDVGRARAHPRAGRVLDERAPAAAHRQPGGDGSLVGPSEPAFVDSATATVPFRFSDPGTYTIVARAKVYAGGATPWTAPFAIRAFAPFDFSSSTFPRSRGPSYRLQVRLREETARGRVRIRVARNWTGRARYRTIGRVRIRRTVRFSAAEGADHTLTAVE